MNAIRKRDDGSAGMAAPPAAMPGGEGIGARTRRLFHALGMFDRPRSPSLKAVHWPVAGPVVTFALACYWLATIGSRVRRRHGVPLWRQVVHLRRLARQGIRYPNYYLFGFYRDGCARAGDYLTRYETKNGLFRALNQPLQESGAPRAPLGDKLAFTDFMTAHGLPVIPVLLTADAAGIEWRAAPAAFRRDLFVKRRRGRGARGTDVIRWLGGDRYRGPGGKEISLLMLGEHLVETGGRGAILLQPRLVNHAELRDLADESLIVIRVVTCLDLAGTPVLTHAMLRVLSMLEPEWHSHIEWAAKIDLASGRLGVMLGDKPKVALDAHARHPVTGAPVLERRLRQWPEAAALALAAHRVCRDHVIIGWDIALTESGAILSEGNSSCDVAFLQRVHQAPIGDSLLGGLLARHLDRMVARLGKPEHAL